MNVTSTSPRKLAATLFNMANPNRIDRIVATAEALSVYGISLPLVKYVTDNPKFALWSGSSKPGQHHYGTGGLQLHIFEVLTYCMANAGLAELMGHKINPKVIFYAALYHDIGKLWDYEPTTGVVGFVEKDEAVIPIEQITAHTYWRGGSHKREIHHISRSAIEWTRAVAATGEGKDIEDEVLHCILSHHGTRDWGSPVAPKSKEAWLLFLCDGISARTTDADTSDMLGRVKSG